MKHTSRPAVALLSFSQMTTDHQPQNRTENPAAAVLSLARALAQIGWQVEVFTLQRSPHEPQTTWLAPFCRLVRLPVDPSRSPAQRVADWAQAIENFQIKQSGLLWPLFHSFDAEAALVGRYLKQTKGWLWLHTPEEGSDRRDQPPEEADQWVLLAATAVVTPLPADQVSQVRYQRQQLAQAPSVDDWQAIARRLDSLYRRHLAAYVGAAGIHLPKLYRLSVPTREQVSRKSGAVSAVSDRALVSQYSSA